MHNRADTNHLGLAFGLRTALYLVGGMLAGLAAGFAVHGLPMHVPEATKNVLSAVPTIILITAAGALWGRSLGLHLAPAMVHRFVWAGGLAYGPAILLAGLGLTLLEVTLVERGRLPQLEIHILYTLLFVPATIMIAGTGALAIGLATGSNRLAASMGARAGLAAGLAFLVVNLAMDALGWRVGAPGAAERATMLTVTALGALAASLAGGWAMGRTAALERRSAAGPEQR